MSELNFIIPNWPAPANVKALQTTRAGGVSHAPYVSLNLGAHVNDDAIAVVQNRQLLSPYLPSEPVWAVSYTHLDVYKRQVLAQTRDGGIYAVQVK